MRKLAGLLIALIAFLALSGAARADGIIIPIPPPGIPRERAEHLAVRYHRVTVTIEDQVATTEVDQVFVNESPHEIEGLYLFPLPAEASISHFSMFVDGQELVGQMLDKEEARSIYEGIVRERRDPALLEYVERNTFRARIYPIPAKGEKRVIVRYTQVLRADLGLVRYLYPLDTERFSSKPIQDVSVHVDIRSKAPIKAVYSPSHEVAVSRDGENHVEVGYEASEVKPDRDFELYYGISADGLALNVLSYKARGEDGFFLLLAAPPLADASSEVVAKDVLVVLDISGSMRGAKLAQAKEALAYIIDHLNEEDRFNILAFSTGTRRFAADLVGKERRDDAHRFVRELEAAGGTNIDRALREALAMTTGARPQVVIFLTDGLATEGVVATGEILKNVNAALNAADARQAARIFAFGLGDDVNTVLLDTLAQDYRGASAYVRPSQSIAEEVSAFYAKIGTPLLADLSLGFGGLIVEEMYPDPLPDLFAGSQLLVVGRYRGGGTTTVTLRGLVNDREATYVYADIPFSQEGGDDFVPRLWATRKIGYLLTQIRLHGEDKELVDEIVALSVRYGIMTPYTSFLVDETEDVLTAQGREYSATQVHKQVQEEAAVISGAAAVDSSVARQTLQDSQVAAAPSAAEIKVVGDLAFLLRNGAWVDTRYDPSRQETQKVPFGSDAYFRLLSEHAEAGRYLSLGQQVIVILDGQAYEIVPADPAAPESATLAPTPPGATATAAIRPTATATPAPAPAPTPRPNLWDRFWQWVGTLLK
ncbi:MAG: VWA domain-containing protein [Chloroflexi bacterium]|nr:VWA domain-containing protein [Chloroflexota bacterium]